MPYMLMHCNNKIYKYDDNHALCGAESLHDTPCFYTKDKGFRVKAWNVILK